MTTTTNMKRILLLTALLLVPLGFRVPNVGAEVKVPENFVLVKAGTTTANNGGITLPYDNLVGKYEVTCGSTTRFVRPRVGARRRIHKIGGVAICR